jgi:septum formation protein
MGDERKSIRVVMRDYHIILASNSPRRRELLSGLDLEYEVKVLPDIEEGYPEGLSMEEIPRYIAAEKAAAYKDIIADNDLIITADTVVVWGDEVLGKPTDLDDARRMLRELSGKTHQVITGVYLMTKEKERGFSVVTDVTFKELSDEEIDYYVEKYRPLDKAGAYGIQEWIGYIGVTGLNGSYFNVMGLPVQRIYNELLLF